MRTNKNRRPPDAGRALELDSDDFLSVVEAAYVMDTPPDVWALEVLRSAACAVGAGSGVFACFSHEAPNSALDIDRTSMVFLGSNDESSFAAFERNSAAVFGPSSQGGCAVRCVLTSEIANERQICEDFSADDAHDGVHFLARDPNDRGFLMSLTVPANVRLPPVTRRALTGVASHVLAAIRLRARLSREHRARTHARGPSSLTETERSAVTAAARGRSTKEIAYAFGIAEATVRVLLMRAARRCGVQSRKELLNLWARSDVADAMNSSPHTSVYDAS